MQVLSSTKNNVNLIDIQKNGEPITRCATDRAVTDGEFDQGREPDRRLGAVHGTAEKSKLGKEGTHFRKRTSGNEARMLSSKSKTFSWRMLFVWVLKFILLSSWVDAFDIAYVAHVQQNVTVDLSETCPCEEPTPCFNTVANQCVAALLTADSGDGDQVAGRCGPFDDCIELQQISQNQQHALVPKQLLIRSTLAKFKDEDSPVTDAYGKNVTLKPTTEYSRWTMVGCFQSDNSVTASDAKAANDGYVAYDPNECVEKCTGDPNGLFRKEYYEQQKRIIIGISGLKCACVVEDMTVFTELPATKCTIPCMPSFANPYCGGDAGTSSLTIWNLYMEYEYQSFGSSGAYDVWRYVWYTVVVIRDSTVKQSGGFASTQDTRPERYYLHCADVDGKALFQNQIRIEAKLIYGLEYDITGSRLVALSVPDQIGRTPVVSSEDDSSWTYELVGIEIDESDESYPRLEQIDLTLGDENGSAMPTLYKGTSTAAEEYLVFTGASTLISKADFRSYGVTQIEKTDFRVDRFFLFSLSEQAQEGSKSVLKETKLISDFVLNFRALQIFSDTRRGTISAVGPTSSQTMIYVVLGYLFKDTTNTPRYHSYYSATDSNSGFYHAENIVANVHIYPGGGTSGPNNNTFMSYRQYPTIASADRPRISTAYSVLQVNMFSGAFSKWCQSEDCENGEEHRSIDPSYPYANLFNAEPGFPLSLSAPKVLHARFTIEGLFLRIVFDKETTRGAIPEDTDGNRLPDRMSGGYEAAGGFDCAEVLEDETIELIGTEATGTKCRWKDDTSDVGGGETLEVELGSEAVIKLGQQIKIRSDRIYAKPICAVPGDYSNCEWSPAVVSQGAVVGLPDPLLPPEVIVEAKPGFTVDSCGKVALEASESKRTGGRAVYNWALDYSDGDPYTPLNTVSSTLNETRYAILQATLASEKGGSLKICQTCMPRGFTFKMIVEVVSRWGLSSTHQFTVKKEELPSATLQLGSWATPTVSTVKDDLRIQATIFQSECAVGEQILACEWTCLSHDPEYTAEAGSTPQTCDETAYNPNKISFPKNGLSLFIPKYTLQVPTFTPGQTVEKAHQYIFRILCVEIQNTGNTADNQNAAQSIVEEVKIRIVRSPLVVNLFPSATEFPQEGTTMAISSRFTMDPDMESVFECMRDYYSESCQTLPEFNGEYIFRCWKVIPGAAEEIAANATLTGITTVQQTTVSGDVLRRCFTLAMNGVDPSTYYQLVNGQIDDWKIKNFGEKEECTRQTQDAAGLLDIGYNVQIDRVAFTRVPEPTVYCYYMRGLVLINTEHMTLTTAAREDYYSWSVVAVHEDGRFGEDQKSVYVVDRPVLTVFVQEIKTDPDLALLPLTSAYFPVTLEGRIPQDPKFTGATYTYRWEIYIKESGGSKAAPKWTEVTDQFEWSDLDVNEWSVEDPRIIFKVDVENSPTTPPSTQLQKDSTYRIILIANALITEGAYAGEYTGKSQIILETAPGPPQSTATPSFFISPDEYVFPDHLLPPVVSYEFVAPQWRSSPSAGTMNAELQYSFGILSNTDIGASGAADVNWFVQRSSAATFAVSAKTIPYDAGPSLEGVVSVCSVYKICAEERYTLKTTFNREAPYIDIENALLSEEATAAELLAAARTAGALGNAGELTPVQSTGITGAIEDQLFNLDVSTLDETGLSQTIKTITAVQDSAAQTAAETDFGKQDATLTQTGKILDSLSTSGNAISAEDAQGVFDVLANTALATGGLDTGRRRLNSRKLVDALAEYEAEFGEDLLETIEKFQNAPAEKKSKHLFLDEEGKEVELIKETDSLVERVSANFGMVRDEHGIVVKRRLSIADVTSTHSGPHSTEETLFTPEHISSVFGSGTHPAGVGLNAASIGTQAGHSMNPNDVEGSGVQTSDMYHAGSVVHGPDLSSRGRGYEPGLMARAVMHTGISVGESGERIKNLYGRRFSSEEFEKRMKILKALHEAGYEIPKRVSDGVPVGNRVHLLRNPIPQTPINKPPSFLVSSEQTRILAKREKKGEFGSALITHKPRKLKGHNHPWPRPWTLDVHVTENKRFKKDIPTPCECCGEYRLLHPKKENGKYLPWHSYRNADMKWVSEIWSRDGSAKLDCALGYNKTAQAWTIWNPHTGVVMTQSINKVDSSGAQRELSPDSLMHIAGSLFGRKAKIIRDNMLEAENGAPILLTNPETLEFSIPYIKIRALPAVITKCDSSFCDMPGLKCFTKSYRSNRIKLFAKEKELWKCCPNTNSETLCNHPPCWFRFKCPSSLEEQRELADKRQKESLRKLKMEVDKARAKRTGASGVTDMFRGVLSGLSTAEMLTKREERVRKLEEQLVAYEEANTHDTIRLVTKNNWFTRWMQHEHMRNTTIGRMWKRLNFTEANAPFSFADKARAYELYHEDMQRRLQLSTTLKLEMTLDDFQRISQVERHELDLLASSKSEYLKKAIVTQNAVIADAKQEIVYSSYDAETAANMAANAAAALEAQRKKHMETRRNISQILTRISIYRDRLVRALIPQLTTNTRDIAKFKTGLFTMQIARVTNMSNWGIGIFPSEFIVPSDSPNYATEANKVTAFAFQYIEYARNLYDWSPSNPESLESAVITLLVFKANADEYPVCMEGVQCNPGNEFIRVFADYSIYSSGICMIWDRFFPDTAGGAWSGRDIVNDGDGCMTLTLGDIGFFVYGRPSYILSLTEAKIYPLSTLISRNKLSTLATLVIELLVMFLLVFWGYKHDERVRSDQRAGRIPYTSFHYDGDGISTPLHANDPIAYKFADVRNALFLKTFWNVLKREHLAISPAYYHESFTRPQKMLCITALVQGLLAINAVVYGNPDKVASGDQFVISGILAALVMFPLYCLMLFMFTGRPTPTKRRMIKRRQVAKELDMINAEKQRLIAQSSLIPPGATLFPGGGMPGMLPIGGMPGAGSGHDNISLLALPPPIASPMPGQLALPAPPGMGQPPAPKYPPPPGFAKGKPPPQELLPPIYFGRAGVPQLPALPSFSPQPKAIGNTPPALGGLKSMTPRSMGKPPPAPPALMPPKAPTPEGGRPQPPMMSSTPPTFPGSGPSGPSGPPPPPAASRPGRPSNTNPPAPPMPSRPGYEGGHNAIFEGRHFAMPPVDEEETYSAKAPPMFDGQHAMMPPPPPGGFGARPPGGKDGAPPGGPPAPPRPPNLNFSSSGMGRMSGAGAFEPKTPTLPPPSTRGFQPSTPKGMPPIIPFGTMRPDTLIQRGQPPGFQPAPFKMPPPPNLVKATGMELALVGSVGPIAPGGGPPMPPGMVRGGMGIAPGLPLPPPPPREDDSAFVRRVRLIYMDRIMREHQKQDLLEMDAVGRPIPNWVFNVSAVMPYVTCATFIMSSVVIAMVFALKFDSWQEQHWYWASMIGFSMIVFLLDVIRAAVITIVELRKFEIRKRSKAGDFVVRKVQKQDATEGLPALLKPKPKVKAKPTSSIPTVAPKFANMERPKFLPDADGPVEPKFPMLGPPGGPPSGNRTPPSQGNRTPPVYRPPGAKTPPKIPFGRDGAVSPTGSNASHSQYSKSLTQSLAARRTQGSQALGGSVGPKPPPPPGMMSSGLSNSNLGSTSGGPRPPPPPGGKPSPPRTPPGKTGGYRTPPRS